MRCCPDAYRSGDAPDPPLACFPRAFVLRSALAGAHEEREDTECRARRNRRSASAKHARLYSFPFCGLWSLVSCLCSLVRAEDRRKIISEIRLSKRAPGPPRAFSSFPVFCFSGPLVSGLSFGRKIAGRSFRRSEGGKWPQRAPGLRDACISSFPVFARGLKYRARWRTKRAEKYVCGR